MPPARSYCLKEAAMSQVTQLVVYRLSRLFKSKGCGKATMACLATTRLRGAGG
jgi:hypothetical protein